MTVVHRSADESLIRELTAIKRRLKEVEKTTAGQVFLKVTGPAGPLALTGSDQDITGLSLTISRPGLYFVWWCSRMGVSTAGGTGDWAAVHLNGTNFVAMDTTVFAMLAGAAISGGGTTVAQATQCSWQVPGTVKLQAKHNGGTLVASVLTGHTTLIAIRTGPA